MMAKSIVLKFINISVFKRLALAIVILLFIIQGISYVDTGGNVCGRLLKGGTLVDVDVWHPTGCMIHNYKSNDGSSCLKKQRVAFVGDVHMKNIYQSFMKKFFEVSKIQQMGTELKFQEETSAVDFYWRPNLDANINSLYETWLKDKESIPNVIIQAVTTPSNIEENEIENATEEFKTNLTQLIPLIDNVVSNSSKLYWMLQAPEPEPINIEDNDEKSVLSIRHKNNLLIEYNQVTSFVFGSSSSLGILTNVSIVNSPAEVVSQTHRQTKYGFNHRGSIAELTTQILMNLFCNDVQRPIDGTCCQRPPPVTFLQFIAFFIGLICCFFAILFYLVRFLYQVHHKSPDYSSYNYKDIEEDPNMYPYIEEASCSEIKKKAKEGKIEKLAEIVMVFTRTILILLYFYICDRSDVFMKANKHFTVARFCLPLVYLILIGIFGINRSKQPGFLNKGQEDEWKGWMILFVLIYHLTGAYDNNSITMHYHLLISMYLFIQGYTNFTHYWETGDFSLERMFSVVLRMNLLAVLLCVVMNRTYQFYFFVPLNTFWFLVLYFGMAIPPRASLGKKSHHEGSSSDVMPRNKRRWLLSCYSIAIFKFILLIVSICIVSRFKNEFPRLFTWWPIVRLFEENRGSVEGWWKTVQLDRFSTLFGAIVSFIYQLLKRFSSVDDLKQGFLFSTKASILSFFTSIAILSGFSYWSSNCGDEETCKSAYTYVCLLPMAAYLLIRNIPGYFRSGFSSFFAWFGKIYLELFIAQYHIWLAADGKGVLVMIASDWPMLNLIFTTLVFVCVSHEINCLTNIFTYWYIGALQNKLRQLITRIFLLLAVILFFVIVNDVTNSRSVS